MMVASLLLVRNFRTRDKEVDVFPIPVGPAITILFTVFSVGIPITLAGIQHSQTLIVHHTRIHGKEGYQPLTLHFHGPH